MIDFSEAYLDAKLALNLFYKHTLTGNWKEAEKAAKTTEEMARTLQVLAKENYDKPVCRGV